MVELLGVASPWQFFSGASKNHEDGPSGFQDFLRSTGHFLRLPKVYRPTRLDVNGGKGRRRRGEGVPWGRRKRRTRSWKGRRRPQRRRRNQRRMRRKRRRT
eukprot:7679012-Pyramimonas_sp.AAC.1